MLPQGVSLQAGFQLVAFSLADLGEMAMEKERDKKKKNRCSLFGY